MAHFSMTCYNMVLSWMSHYFEIKPIMRCFACQPNISPSSSTSYQCPPQPLLWCCSSCLACHHAHNSRRSKPSNVLNSPSNIIREPSSYEISINLLARVSCLLFKTCSCWLLWSSKFWCRLWLYECSIAKKFTSIWKKKKVQEENWIVSRIRNCSII